MRKGSRHRQGRPPNHRLRAGLISRAGQGLIQSQEETSTVDTYRADNSQEDFSTGSRSYDAEASRRSAYPPHPLGTRADARRNVDDELRRQRRADLFFEDSIVLLSILLGGAVGYMTATTVRRTTWSSNPPRRSSQRVDHGRPFGQQGRTPTSRSVEKDETTDLIASNKVEGTAVYNRQGEKLGRFTTSWWASVPARWLMRS